MTKMDIFNLIAGICSILGFLISILVANKVYKITQNIKNSNNMINSPVNGNENQFQIGDGK